MAGRQVSDEGAIAIEEAGHCLAAHAVGRSVFGPRLDQTGGTTEVAPPTHRNDQRARRELLLILAAGSAARRLCAPPLRTRDGGWRL